MRHKETHKQTTWLLNAFTGLSRRPSVRVRDAISLYILTTLPWHFLWGVDIAEKVVKVTGQRSRSWWCDVRMATQRTRQMTQSMNHNTQQLRHQCTCVLIIDLWELPWWGIFRIHHARTSDVVLLHTWQWHTTVLDLVHDWAYNSLIS